MILGMNVKRYRKEADMTQAQLAEKIGVAQTFVGLIERGERQPSIETLVALADVFNVEVDRLLKENAEPAKA